MTPFRLNEPVVKALVARLVADLPAEIDRINAAVTDGHTIDYPQKVLDHPPVAEQMTSYPIVSVQDFPSTFEQDGGSWAVGRHELAIVAFIAAPDQATLAWRLRRYAQAIANVSLRDRNLGGSAAWGTGLVDVRPGPTLEVEEDPRGYESWTVVRIFAKRDED